MNINERVVLIKEFSELLRIEFKSENEVLRLNELKSILGFEKSNEAVLKDYLPVLINKLSISNGILNISGDSFVMEEANIKLKDYIFPTKELKDDERYLVHCTNFFPNNHIIKCLFDGKKTYTSTILVNGEEKEVEYLYHRHTTHHVSNGVVQNTTDGNNWDSAFIVIEPFLGHEGDVYDKTVSDTFTNGSLKLSDKAVVLIRKDVVDQLTEEQLKEYNYIIFEGDFRNALQNYLVFNNIKIVQGDRNYASHSRSGYSYMEKLLKIRDICLNYVKNNVFDGETSVQISLDEFADIIKIFEENYESLNHEFTYNRAWFDDKVLAFIYCSGFVLNSDNTISLMSEEEILDRYLNHSDLSLRDVEKLCDIMHVHDEYVTDLENRKMEEKEQQEEHSEALLENEILSTKVRDLKIKNISQLDYINYIKRIFNEKYINYKINFKNDMAVIIPSNELGLDLGDILEYDKEYEWFTIMFDQDKTVLENIKESIRRFDEIFTKIESMRETVNIDQTNRTL